MEAKATSKRRGQQPSLMAVWSKRCRDEDKESNETVSTLDEPPSTSTEHDRSTEPEVGELLSDCVMDSQSGPAKNAGGVPACSNICCSCEGEAYQPKNEVILASLSNKGRRFLPVWYERFPWITICATRRKIFCTYCRQARSLKMLSFSKKGDDAFTTKGFDNLKKATEKFRAHEACDTHLEALLKCGLLRNKSISEQLNLTAKIQNERRCEFMKQLKAM